MVAKRRRPARGGTSSTGAKVYKREEKGRARKRPARKK